MYEAWLKTSKTEDDTAQYGMDFLREMRDCFVSEMFWEYHREVFVR